MGAATAAKMPMIKTVITNSTSVKPARWREPPHFRPTVRLVTFIFDGLGLFD